MTVQHPIEKKVEPLQRWIESLFSRELNGLPCYVLHSVELPPEDLPLERFLAFTSVVASDRYETFLQARGCWKGSGFAVVLSPDGWQLSDFGIRHVLIHELAHYLQHSGNGQPQAHCPVLSNLAKWVDPKRITEMVREAANSWWGPRFGECPPWVVGDHAGKWIRLALHLGHRADLQGFPFDPSRAFVAGPHYGLSHPAKYQQALTGELWERRWDPLAEIMATPAPDEFNSLFLRDVVQWGASRVKSSASSAVGHNAPDDRPPQPGDVPPSGTPDQPQQRTSPDGQT